MSKGTVFNSKHKSCHLINSTCYFTSADSWQKIKHLLLCSWYQCSKTTGWIKQLRAVSQITAKECFMITLDFWLHIYFFIIVLHLMIIMFMDGKQSVRAEDRTSASPKQMYNIWENRTNRFWHIRLKKKCWQEIQSIRAARHENTWHMKMLMNTKQTLQYAVLI